MFGDALAIEFIDDREEYRDLNGDPEERVNIIGRDANGTLLVVTYYLARASAPADHGAKGG